MMLKQKIQNQVKKTEWTFDRNLWDGGGLLEYEHWKLKFEYVKWNLSDLLNLQSFQNLLDVNRL